MTKDFILPPALERGDKVAIVGVGNGPTSDLFPEVYDYQKHNFKVTEETSHELEGGIEIKAFKMEKKL